MTLEVVVVDDEPHMRASSAQALELAGFRVTSCAAAEEALDAIAGGAAGVVISDIKMPGTDGLELMRKVRAIDPELPVILVTGHGDIPMAISAIRDGAYEFIEKPFPTELLIDATRRAMERHQLVLENRALTARLCGDGLERSVIGQSATITRFRNQLQAYAATDADVLIIGETGAGKDLAARMLHRFSPRRDGRFVAINCGAVPGEIIESELFGHEAGAFTGAVKRRIGKFEFASGGTLLLDEIESMPMELQVSLLRVLQERAIERLGSNETIPIDVRVIAATKKDLRATAAAGMFREDLFFRLNVLPLEVPPLRRRIDDVPLLFHAFLAEYAGRCRRDPPQVTPETLTLLLQHGWPGNVRELQNAAYRFALGLGLDITDGVEEPTSIATSGLDLPDRIALVERQIIAQELERQGGNLKATYEALGIARKTLYDKMRRYNLGKLPPD